MTRTAIDHNYSINIDDLCYKPVSTRSCYLPSPIDYWKLDASALFIDDNVKEIAKCLKSIVNAILLFFIIFFNRTRA